jgi:hypothetical protein
MQHRCDFIISICIHGVLFTTLLVLECAFLFEALLFRSFLSLVLRRLTSVLSNTTIYDLAVMFDVTASLCIVEGLQYRHRECHLTGIFLLQERRIAQSSSSPSLSPWPIIPLIILVQGKTPQVYFYEFFLSTFRHLAAPLLTAI